MGHERDEFEEPGPPGPWWRWLTPAEALILAVAVGGLGLVVALVSGWL